MKNKLEIEVICNGWINRKKIISIRDDMYIVSLNKKN